MAALAENLSFDAIRLPSAAPVDESVQATPNLSLVRFKPDVAPAIPSQDLDTTIDLSTPLTTAAALHSLRAPAMVVQPLEFATLTPLPIVGEVFDPRRHDVLDFSA